MYEDTSTIFYFYNGGHIDSMAPPKGFIPWNKGKTGIYHGYQYTEDKSIILDAWQTN